MRAPHWFWSYLLPTGTILHRLDGDWEVVRYRPGLRLAKGWRRL